MSWLLLAGSLAAVLALSAIAWLLRLGGGAIADAEEAKRLAEENIGGFAADEAVVSSDGAAALVRGRSGELALIKAHGTQVAARRLARPVAAQAIEGGVRIASGERMFGAVAFKLSDADRDKLLTMV
jgi:hypothetical protein